MAMDKTPPPPEYRALVERLHAAAPELVEKAMFGVPTVFAHGKPFVGSYGGGALFKLDPGGVEAALELPGVELFDPSGKGRPMKAWVVVPLAEHQRWAELADAALAVSSR